MLLHNLFEHTHIDESDTASVNWHTDSEQRSMDATRGARLNREREPSGSEAIDARLRAQNDQMAQYTQSGKFWLKQKDTQQHIGDQSYSGKAAANAAALELLKQRPELKGNLVITAWGPGESQGVAEGTDERKQNALWAQITAHEKAAKASKDLKRQHHLKMADQLRSQLKTSDNEQGVAEGYTVTRGIDRERYQARAGLEGPFSTRSGKVVYYDPQEGKYYDPETDFYIDHEDYAKMDEAQYDSGDYYNAHSGAEYGRDLSPTGNGGAGEGTKRDDIFKGQSKHLPADPFRRTTGEIPRAEQGKVHSIAQPDEMDEGEKVGNMDADQFDAAMARLKKLAGSGPMRTVYDPAKRVYRNVPTAQQPAQQPKK
jgi:hypothetical protein